MRRVLTLTLGVIIGQWLAFGALPSPAEFNAQGLAAWERRDYTGALHHWSEGVVHDPGPGIEGILGNSFLARYRVTVDAQRRLLTLAPAARD